MNATFPNTADIKECVVLYTGNRHMPEMRTDFYEFN
jgi:hypothetical protein